MSDTERDEKPVIPGLSLLEDDYARDERSREQYAFLLTARDKPIDPEAATSRSSSRSASRIDEDREKFDRRGFDDRSARYDERSRESTRSREMDRYDERSRDRAGYDDERSRDRFDEGKPREKDRREDDRPRDRYEEERPRERERYDDRRQSRYEDDRPREQPRFAERFAEREREPDRPSRYEADDRSFQRDRPDRSSRFEPIDKPKTSFAIEPQMDEAGTSGGPGGLMPAGFKRKHEFTDDRPQFKKKMGGMGGKRGKTSVLKLITPKEIFTTKPVDNVKQAMDKEFKSIHMQTNYFNIIKKPQFDMVQYRADFYPHCDLLSAKKAFLREHKGEMGGYIFDGTCCFLARKLPFSPYEMFSKTRDGKQQKIVLKEVAVISMTNQTSVQLLNLIMRKALEGLKLQLVGRNFFDAAAKIQMRNFRLELWPGYITSIRQHEHDILLCAEIAHKVMRNENVYDILQESYKMNQNWKEAFMKKVIGTTVLTDYNNKTYRIDDVDFNQCPGTTFDTKTGPESFVDYYMRKYGIKIRDSKQPLLISKSKMKEVRAGQSELIALIPELCRATGFTDEMRTDFKLMKAVSEFTRLTPNVYKDRLQLFNERLHSTPTSVEELNDFNLVLDKELVEVDGHICPKNQIFLGNNQVVEVTENADWNDALKSNSNNSMYSSKKLTRWIVLCPIQYENEARNFIGMLRRACDGMKYVVIEPRWKMIPNDRIESYSKSLDEFLNLDPQLVFCVVPNNRADRYSAIKKKCCIGRSVATQVILTKTINPRPGKSANLMSVATKVAIQLNCKMGGAPWMLPVPLSGLMTIGFDVYHDSRERGKSYGAMVATMDLKDNNPENVKFYSCVTGHKNGEELSNSLSNNITMALKEFKRQHEALPQRIIFYRDGVGDGQIEYIHNHEVQQLKNQIAQVYRSLNQAMPKFCYVIVNKRINARLFSHNRNPPPGTVVDDIITLPERYDFYLISQSVRQGTAAPTAYNIITDTLRIGPARMQMLTYRFTHLYYNWSGTIRVPAVCQYAHRLAYLTGQYLHGAPSNGLERQLYFL